MFFLYRIKSDFCPFFYFFFSQNLIKIILSTLIYYSVFPTSTHTFVFAQLFSPDFPFNLGRSSFEIFRQNFSRDPFTVRRWRRRQRIGVRFIRQRDGSQPHSRPSRCALRARPWRRRTRRWCGDERGVGASPTAGKGRVRAGAVAIRECGFGAGTASRSADGGLKSSGLRRDRSALDARYRHFFVCVFELFLQSGLAEAKATWCYCQVSYASFFKVHGFYGGQSVGSFGSNSLDKCIHVPRVSIKKTHFWLAS